MNPLRIFISSVQGEFAEERAALRDYIRGDPLVRRIFDVFLFSDPASSRAGHGASRPAVGIWCHAGAGRGARGESGAKQGTVGCKQWCK